MDLSELFSHILGILLNIFWRENYIQITSIFFH